MRANVPLSALLVISSSLALAACGDSGTADVDADGDGEITTAEVVAEMAEGSPMSMRPGQWEQTLEFTDMEMPGMPPEALAMMKDRMGSSFTTKTCLTEQDVQQPDADFFGGGDEGNCTYDRFERSGNHMEMQLTCDPGNGTIGTMILTGEFGEDEYTMEMNNTVSGAPMGDMTMKGKMTARRIGDCP